MLKELVCDAAVALCEWLMECYTHFMGIVDILWKSVITRIGSYALCF